MPAIAEDEEDEIVGNYISTRPQNELVSDVDSSSSDENELPVAPPEQPRTRRLLRFPSRPRNLLQRIRNARQPVSASSTIPVLPSPSRPQRSVRPPSRLGDWIT
jgi:hypothetical protein